MFTIKIPPLEIFDDELEEFRQFGADEITFEHSLYTIARYEEATHKPYYDTRSDEDNLFSYMPYMAIKPPKDPSAFFRIPQDELAKLKSWMEDSHTATWFSKDDDNSPEREIVTAELIYYWMTEYRIPFECERWHINRLMTLIQVCARKKSPPKQKSQAEIIREHRALNQKRRAERAARKKGLPHG